MMRFHRWFFWGVAAFAPVMGVATLAFPGFGWLLAAYWWVYTVVLVMILRGERRDPARWRDDGIDLPLGSTTLPMATSAMNGSFGIGFINSSALFADQPWRPWLAGACLIYVLIVAFAVVRRLGGVLRVEPAGLSILSWRGRVTWTRAWDDITRIGPPRGVGGNGFALRVVLGGRDHWSDREVPTVGTAHPMWVLIEWLEHYRDHPDDRDELVSQAGVERLERIHDELRDPDVEPQWFPPPRARVG